MSVSVYRNLLEKILFPKDEDGLIVIQKNIQTETKEGQQNTGFHEIPRTMFPEHCQTIELSDGELFLSEVKAAVAQLQPKRVFIVSPWMLYRDLPDELKRK